MLVQSPTAQRQLDEMVSRLREGAVVFARLSLEDRIALARSMQAGYMRIAAASVRAACEAKGIGPGKPVECEEWESGPCGGVRHLRLVMESLRSIRRTGTTPIGPVSRTMDGRVAVRVFPANGVDRLVRLRR